MRRADRLFRIIQLLRGHRRARTAHWLAEQLEVSERTVYRDVRDLIASGTPIEGEAGVGYTLRHYDLPPLMFDADEIEALALGARVVQTFGDPALAQAAASVISKVEAVLPARLRPRLGGAALFAPRPGNTVRDGVAHLLVVRTALGARRKLRLGYRRMDGEESQRIVRPLGAFLWGLYQILVRLCSRTDSSETTLLWSAFVGCAAISTLGPWQWKMPDAGAWIGLFAIAVLGTLSHFALIKALTFAEAGAVQPYSYTLLVWATVLGFLVFGDIPDVWTIAGAGVIVASGLYTWHRDRLRSGGRAI